MPQPIQIRLLGALEIHVDGHPLPRPRTRKVHLLLALLALRQGKPLDRETIAATLWPQSKDETARFNLRQALRELRHALGASADLLLSPSPRQLQLAHDPIIFVDAIAFDRASDAGDTARAIEIYRGPLLDGYHETWIDQEREHRHQRFLDALEAHAKQAMEQADLHCAIDCLQRLMASDPLRESAAARLIDALVQRGDPAQALQVYRNLRLQLHEQLHSQPGPQVQEAMARVRAAPVAAPPSPWLPHPLTRLIGRDQETRQLHARLARNRLVTLVGAGGVGKTRLAIRVAHESRFPGGVHFLDLTPLSDPALLAATLLRGLDLSEEPLRPPRETLVRWLASREVLLVVDNCEHLLPDIGRLSGELLSRCPRLHVLATSRQVLEVPGESVYRVPSLPDGDAVSLFWERADRMGSAEERDASSRVCTQLDGIPLAIELAAARVRSLSALELERRLGDRFALLSGGSGASVPRHRTLGAAIDWSYGLLSEPERVLLRRLSVFAGGWTLESAEGVCGFSPLSAGEIVALLSGLVDKSLVEFRSGGVGSEGGRYVFLETVRQYGEARLKESGEETEAQDRHTRFFYDLSNRLWGMRGPEFSMGQWTRCVEEEHDNLCAVLRRWEGTLLLDECIPFMWFLWNYWDFCGRLAEMATWQDSFLSWGERSEMPHHRSMALGSVGYFALSRGEYRLGQSFWEQVYSVHANSENPENVWWSLMVLGGIALKLGEYDRAQELCEKSVSISRGFSEIKSLAEVVLARGDLKTAQYYAEEAGGILDSNDNDYVSNYYVARLHLIGCIAFYKGESDKARYLLEKSIQKSEELGIVSCKSDNIYYLGRIACDRGEHEHAHALLSQALALNCDRGNRDEIARNLDAFANEALARKQGTRAACLLGAAAGQRDALGIPLPPVEQPYYERTRSEIRELLGDVGFQEAWDRGRAMTLDQAVDYALQITALPGPQAIVA